MDHVAELIRYLVIGVFLVVFAYVLVRGTSFAYFRSRYEHFRMLRKLKNQEDKNG